MRHGPHAPTARAAALLMAALLATTACGDGDDGAGQGEQQAGRRGGVLRVVGQGGVDHLDTAAAYYTSTYVLERAFARQLVTYPADADAGRAAGIVADAAAEVPTRANGGISADGRTYRFAIRPGVRWDTQPPRQVTAADFARGLERLCNPAAPTGAPGYFTTTITGFKTYCDGLAKVPATAQAIKAYLDKRDIAGVRVTGDLALEIKLRRPASDFLNIMALPFASAAPVEYLAYVPDSAEFRRNTISDGPYSITEYEADKRIVLTRNPAWTAEADTVRAAWVDRVEFTFGVSAESVQQQLETGAADLAWDTPVPTAQLPALRGDERLGIHRSGSVNPYVVINLKGNNNRGALRKLAVRQALNYAVDKVAISQVYGGPDISTPLHQVLPPSVEGHKPLNPYPTPEAKGDPARARRLLAEAGYPQGLTLKMIYRSEGNQPRVAQTLQASLAKAGITLRLQAVPPADFYGRYLDAPDAARRGLWDIATPGWVPDWPGNAARTLFVPLFYGKEYGPGSTNSGGYQDPQTDACIERALAAADPGAAAATWHECDKLVMADAPFVPLLNQKLVTFRAERVENFIFLPFTAAGDITHVWLAEG